MLNHLIPATADLVSALKAINNLSGHARTLFVHDEERHIVGSVTGGDIRRAILRGTPLDTPVTEAMNAGFVALDRQDPRCHEIVREARNKGIELLPVLDVDRHLIEILDLSKIKALLPLDAVLMAGGKGERLRPLTLTTPKPLLTVGPKAIIDYNIEALEANGITDIYVTVNYLHEQIEQHFDARKNIADITCILEPKRLGTLGSVTLIDSLHHDNVLIMNSDLLTNLNFAEMFDHHVTTGADITIAAVPYTVSVPYAIMRANGTRVTAIEEKPTFNYYANGGVYIIRRALLETITPGEYLDAPDFITRTIRDGGHVEYFPINGRWIDIGSPDDYRYADDLMTPL